MKILTSSAIPIILVMLLGCQGTSGKLEDIDGNTYAVITHNETIWMAEDLRVTRDPSGNTVSYYYPNGDSLNVEIYGLLYDFDNACKVCPNGWRLPSNQEWEDLLELNTTNDASRFKDPQYWNGEENTNIRKLSIKPSGIGNNQEHPNQFREKTLYWSSDKEEDHFIWTYILERGNDTIRKASQHPTYGFSVRCVKNQS